MTRITEGYGFVLFGGGFTGTPDADLALAGVGARDYRIGWRLTSAVPGDFGFEVNPDASRAGAAGSPPGRARRTGPGA